MILIAFGKAASAMMEQALQHVPNGQPTEAIVVTNYGNAREISRCQTLAAGHPIPDENGQAAGIAVMNLLSTTTRDDSVLCLVSGGGSALLTTPRIGITLADKIEVNKTLLASGFAIDEMNAIRQQLSDLKGGGLADAAYPADVRSLIISDVIGDNICVIASGPTGPAVNSCASTVALLQQKCIWSTIPKSAQQLLTTPRNITQRTVQNTLVCTNRNSLDAIAAAAHDWSPVIVSDHLDGDVADAAEKIVAAAAKMPLTGPQLLIWGGETTVTLTGTGKGGRNQELALRVATLAHGMAGRWVFLSGGTDGRDGPTDAAGGIADNETLSRSGGDVTAALANNDSYNFLRNADALLMTGATGTNVADIQLLLRVPH